MKSIFITFDRLRPLITSTPTNCENPVQNILGIKVLGLCFVTQLTTYIHVVPTHDINPISILNCLSRSLFKLTRPFESRGNIAGKCHDIDNHQRRPDVPVPQFHPLTPPLPHPNPLPVLTCR